jgi:5-methyltetrahydrofolate--homocysteine methyltransferase
MGTMLQRYNFSKKIWRTFQRFSTFLKRKQRFIITHTATSDKAVHAAYFEAGADIVETNTFSGTTIEWPIII